MKKNIYKLKDLLSFIIIKLKIFFNNIGAIYIRDLKNLFINYAVLIVVGGLLLVPSLYAWVNILANWDPYTNTGNIKIAVVNNDIGAVFNDVRIDVGKDIVEELKHNTAIGWTIVSDYEGNFGLHNGEYYALIEIPVDFSSDLISYATPVPIKPNIIYRANQKSNAIATKITDAAKKSLTNTIKENIVITVNTKIMEQLNDLAIEVEENKEEILTFVDIMNGSEEQVDKIINQLWLESNNIESTQYQLGKTKDDMNNFDNRIDNLQDTNNEVRNMANNSNANIKHSILELNDNVETINKQSEELDKNLNSLSDVVNDSENQEQAISAIDAMIAANEATKNTIDDASDNADTAITDDDTRNAFLDILSSTSKSNQTTTDNLISLKEDIESGKAQKNIMISVNMAKQANSIYRSNVNQTYKFFLNVVIPMSEMTANSIDSSTRHLDTYLSLLEVVSPQVIATSNFGIAMGDVANNQILRASKKLKESKVKLADIDEITNKIDEHLIDDAIKLMSKNSETVGNFLADPIEVEEYDIYGTNPFGVGLTPFYTVLGIWVGILLMTTLLSIEVHPFEDEREITHIQEHFGKMLLFLTIAIIQTTICVVGDVVLLGVKPAEFGLFFLLAYLCCIVFTVLIYTLVSLFGDVGKAIAVIIMVFQIAGSGGIYPVQTNPEIFGQLKYLWPFYYAIDAFRQAISGANWNMTMYDIHNLLKFLYIFFILGFIKKYASKSTEFFEEQFAKAKLK